jgi:hypothetical protein
MRTRWHKSWLLALLVAACGLNPHPEIPGVADGDDPRVPQTGAGGSSSGGSKSGAAGNGNVGVPSGGALTEQPGVGGRFEYGEAGDSGMSEGGAAEGGAAGADQLAPGPPR